MAQKSFEGLVFSVPTLEEVAKCVGLRLHAEESGDPTYGNYPANYRPPAEVILSTVKRLRKLVKDVQGDSWQIGSEIIDERAGIPIPKSVIAADVLVTLVASPQVPLDVARWAVFDAIQNGVLSALHIAWSPFTRSPSDVIRDRDEMVKSRIANIKKLKAARSRKLNDKCSVAPADRSGTGLFVWSSDQNIKRKRGARAKDNLSSKEERLICQAWETGTYRTYAELAAERGRGESAEYIKRVVARCKKRQQRSQKPLTDE